MTLIGSLPSRTGPPTLTGSLLISSRAGSSMLLTGLSSHELNPSSSTSFRSRVQLLCLRSNSLVSEIWFSDVSASFTAVPQLNENKRQIVTKGTLRDWQYRVQWLGIQRFWVLSSKNLSTRNNNTSSKSKLTINKKQKNTFWPVMIKLVEVYTRDKPIKRSQRLKKRRNKHDHRT